MNQTGTDSELQRRLELLAGKALGDLSAEEQMDVDELLQERHWQSALWQLEATAAAVDLRLRPEQHSPLPLGLAQLVQKDAVAFFNRESQHVELDATMRQSSSVSSRLGPENHSVSQPTSVEHTASVEHTESDRPVLAQQSVLAESALPTVSLIKPTSSLDKGIYSHSRREWLGWICCAASLLLALGLWSVNRRPVESSSAAAARDMLLASAADIVQIDWAAGTTPFSAEVVGDVVWSTERQLGFMRFRGMPVNDPTVEQYQLWIIDPERDEQPIDGGVFDIAENGEVIVPIDAKLKVNVPKAFAITIEQPGGVVVSDQSRLPLLAAVE